MINQPANSAGGGHSSMRSTRLSVSAILFDMDGTLIDSTAGVTGAWEQFAQQQPGLDVTKILQTSHGVRTIDNLRKWCPLIPEEKLEEAVVDFELEIVRSAKRHAEAGELGIVMLPGVREIISQLGDSKWAICTSATRAYASAALTTAGIPIPAAFVAAEDVSRGKPFPDPYLLGARFCGVDISNCLVVEDAPSGIASGKASGAKVLAVSTSHARESLAVLEPDYLVQDLSSLSITRAGNLLEILINHE